MLTSSRGVALLALTLSSPACARFQPNIALRPTPDQASTTFVLSPQVRHRPELDRGTFRESDSPEHRHTPEELAAALPLVQQCLAQRAPSLIHHVRVVAGSSDAPPANSFVIELAVVTARPGFYRADRMTGVSANASAPGVSASGSGAVATASTHVSGQAEAAIFVRAASGAIVDDNRLFAQRFPTPDEPLEMRANELCVLLLDEADQYFQWRLSGNGR